MKTKILLAFFSLLMLPMIWACSNELPSNETSSGQMKMKISIPDYDLQEVRALATAVENRVLTLDVAFFDASGNIITFPNGKSWFYYDVASPTLTEWENGSTSTNTVILPVDRADVLGARAVVFINLGSANRASMTAGSLNTLSALNAAVHQTVSTIGGISAPLLMYGAKAVTSQDYDDRRVTVPVERAVAKVKIKFFLEESHIATAAQNPALMVRPNASYQYFDLPGVTRLTDDDIKAGNTRLVASPFSDAAPTYYPTMPLATIKSGDTEPSIELDAFYVNEYNLEALAGTATATAPLTMPYVTVAFPAEIGPNDRELNFPFPPPSAYDPDATRVYPCYYKLIFPYSMKRNNYYNIIARVTELGAPNETGAPVLKIQFVVLPWVTSTIYSES